MNINETLGAFEMAVVTSQDEQARIMSKLYDAVDILANRAEGFREDVELRAQDTVELAVNSVRDSVELLTSRSIIRVSDRL